MHFENLGTVRTCNEAGRACRSPRRCPCAILRSAFPPPSAVRELALILHDAGFVDVQTLLDDVELNEPPDAELVVGDVVELLLVQAVHIADVAAAAAHVQVVDASLTAPTSQFEVIRTRHNVKNV